MWRRCGSKPRCDIEIVGRHAVPGAAVVPKRHRSSSSSESDRRSLDFPRAGRAARHIDSLSAGESPFDRAGAWAREKRRFLAGDRMGAHKTVYFAVLIGCEPG